MLHLLTVDQAAGFILHWQKQIPDPTDPATMIKVLEDKDLLSSFYRHKIFINNAIDAGELPAIRKPKSKPEEKRLMNHVDIPEDIKGKIDKLHDVWVSWEDLLVFVERSASISRQVYSHSRHSLATIAWVLINKADYGEANATELHENLSELMDDYDVKNIKLQLGETTLKNCIKEIFDTKKYILEGKI